MGRSRRRAKKGKLTVKVGLPGRRRAANKLPKAQTLILPSKETVEWDVEGTLTSNYRAAGFALDPNKAVGLALSVRRQSQGQGEGEDSGDGWQDSVGGPIGLDHQLDEEPEPEELQVTLGKRRKGGAETPRYERLTKMQRVHVGKLMARHGLDHQAMARDMKLNKLQLTAGQLKFLCARYLAYEKVLPVAEAPEAAA